MGVAAYNRGTAAIRDRIEAENFRPREFEMMDILNSIPKNEDCGRPFGPVNIVKDSKGFWSIECPRTGYGYWYKTIHEIMRRWSVTIIGYDPDTKIWSATPTP